MKGNRVFLLVILIVSVLLFTDLTRAIAAAAINAGIHSTISIVRGVSRGLPLVALADLLAPGVSR